LCRKPYYSHSERRERASDVAGTDRVTKQLTIRVHPKKMN
jgi:hypothetical protein